MQNSTWVLWWCEVLNVTGFARLSVKLKEVCKISWWWKLQWMKQYFNTRNILSYVIHGKWNLFLNQCGMHSLPQKLGVKPITVQGILKWSSIWDGHPHVCPPLGKKASSEFHVWDWESHSTGSDACPFSWPDYLSISTYLPTYLYHSFIYLLVYLFLSYPSKCGCWILIPSCKGF